MSAAIYRCRQRSLLTWLLVFIIGPRVWLIRWVSDAKPVNRSSQIGGRSAYDVKGNEMWVAFIRYDDDVLCPARGYEYGSVNDEIVCACTCSAHQENSFTIGLASSPQDEGDLASTGVDHCFGATDAYPVRRGDAPSVIEHKLSRWWPAQDSQGYHDQGTDRRQQADPRDCQRDARG